MFIVPISPMPSISQLKDMGHGAPEANGTSIPFADVLSSAMDNMKETQAVSEQDAFDLSMGNMDDLHTMQINSAKAAAAMEFTVELTTRAVNAYKDILNTQV